MTERDFWLLVEEVFGRAYGYSICHDVSLPVLMGDNAVEALARGEEPRVVWNVLCDHMDIPDSQRWGSSSSAPPLPVR